MHPLWLPLGKNCRLNVSVITLTLGLAVVSASQIAPSPGGVPCIGLSLWWGPAPAHLTRKFVTKPMSYVAALHLVPN